MLLRVGLRSSVLREVRFFVARSGRPRPLGAARRLLRGCSKWPRRSPLLDRFDPPDLGPPSLRAPDR